MPKDQLDASVILKRDTGIETTQQDQEKLEDDAEMPADHPTEAEKLLREEKRNSTDTPVSLMEKDRKKDRKDEKFTTNIKKMLADNELESEDFSKSGFSGEKASENVESENAENKSKENVKTVRENTNNKNEDMSDFMNEIEEEDIRVSKTNNTKIKRDKRKKKNYKKTE